MDFKKRFTYIILFIVAIIFLCGAFFYMFLEIQDNGYENVINNNMNNSLKVDTKINALIQNNYNALELIAAFPDTISFNEEELATILDDSVAIYSDLDFIGISDESGMQIAKSNGLERVNIADRDHFIEPMNGADKYISDIISSKMDGSYLCMMSVPINNTETTQIDGVVVASLNLDILTEFILNNEVLKDDVITMNSTSFILDSQGYILVHPDLEFSEENVRTSYATYEFVQDALQGNTDTVIYVNENDEEMLVSYVVNKDTGWITCSEVPVDIASAELKERLTYLSLLYLTVISILILIIVMLNLNIRKRRVAELSLADLNDSLEEKVERRSKELEISMKELTERERLASLGRLVAGVSHEINTPLGVSITANSYMDKTNEDAYKKLKANQFNKTDLINYMEKMEESTTIVTSNLTRAAELVKSFKSLAVNQTAQKKITFNLKSYISSIILAIKHEYKRRPITIDIDIDDQLEINSYAGDYAQIITNFLMNSLRHGFGQADEGVITIKAFKEDKILSIIYTDNGRGISKEHLNHIFDPFFTSDRSSESSGLGLNIVYNIIHDHLKGTILCQSEEGHGVVFTIKIPIIGERVL